ncbi:MAG: hypothetical protein IKZ15_04105 [Clostridia bacterium]|nr:hypothetical protein [Clostridia bacterium]
MTHVCTLTLPLPPVNEREALRYAACPEPDEATLSLLLQCINEAQPIISPRVCWCVQEVTMTDGGCMLGHIDTGSHDLGNILDGCDQAVIFGATLGVELDRLINKYGHLSPVRALMLQALGSERIEALCDSFCTYISETLGRGLTPRFSPGYGDMKLERQAEIFALLDCPKNIGLCLTQGMIMTPSKSVTAICGIGGSCGSCGSHNSQCKCGLCTKTDCLFRRSV